MYMSIRIIIGVLVFSLLAAAAAFSIDQNPNARRVVFPKGASSTEIKGSVKNYDTCDYVLGARAGQKMSVKLDSSSNFAYFAVFIKKNGQYEEMKKPVYDDTAWSGVLPESGDYVVRVYLVRAEARNGGQASFTLSVAIR
jgi:hypothetical protein